MARRGRKSNPARADPGRRNKSWSEAEDAYLQDKWGVVSIQGIAKALGRTENAVLNRKNRLGLGAHLDGEQIFPITSFLLSCMATEMDPTPRRDLSGMGYR